MDRRLCICAQHRMAGLNSPIAPARVLPTSLPRLFSLTFNLVMSLPFYVIRLDSDHFSFIKTNGFVPCDISPDESQEDVKRMAYCLHCKKLKTYAWANGHSRELQSQNVNLAAFFSEDKVEVIRGNIISEIELQFEHGKLLPKKRSAPVRSAFRRSTSFTVVGNEVHLFDHPPRPPAQKDHDSVGGSLRGQEPEQPKEPSFRHHLACALECILKDSFGLSGFVPNIFLALSGHFLERLSSLKDAPNPNIVKARIITSMVRTLARNLSLSKSQTTQMVDLLKAIICFISPEKEEVAKKKFASYTSCVRQSEADDEAKQNSGTIAQFDELKV